MSDNTNNEEVENFFQDLDIEESPGSEVIIYYDDEKEISEPIDVTKQLESSVDEVTKSLDKMTYDKSFKGSNQTEQELGGDVSSTISMNLESRIVEPPYEPEHFEYFLNSSDIHFRACTTKVLDSIGRKYVIKSKHPIKQSGSTKDIHDNAVNKEDL
jgi:hypothetical protein